MDKTGEPDDDNRLHASAAHAETQTAGHEQPASTTATDEADGDTVSRRTFVGSLAAAFGGLSTEGADLSQFARNESSLQGRASGSAPPKEWHERTDVFGMVYLMFLRDWLRNSNLYDTEDPPLAPRSGNVPADYLHARTMDGSWNDLDFPSMGSANRRLGRNVPLEMTFPDPAMLDPNPRRVSIELMTRHEFIPATSLNVLAAAWIQFQVHDWFAHELGTDSHVHKIPLPHNDPWPHGPICIPKTPAAQPGTPCQRPPAYSNRVSHWWDGSQLYGIDSVSHERLRLKQDGKIRVRPSGLLEFDSVTGEEITGFMPNSWIGISLLHGIFALEHNAICDRLKSKHPSWSDDELYHKARLITAALLAKIHTLEWTLAVLDTKLLKLAMSTNWHGLLGRLQEFSTAFEDNEILGGIMGSGTDHHTAPYSLTEEFVTVYRMHPLMPDDYRFYSARDGTLLETARLGAIAGKLGPPFLKRYESNLHDLFYSFGIAHPGAITLQNYPRTLQELPVENGTYLDLATVDIVRDRERGVPRYNAFRRLLGKPPLRTFAELTPNGDLARTLEAVYGDVDRVDTMVGLLAEPPPKGFAFSETAFRVFILMASRRLKSDRFYTKYWTDDTYTKEGREWVEENTMTTVLRRHFPDLKRRLGKKCNAFQPWTSV